MDGCTFCLFRVFFFAFLVTAGLLVSISRKYILYQYDAEFTSIRLRSFGKRSGVQSRTCSKRLETASQMDSHLRL